MDPRATSQRLRTGGCSLPSDGTLHPAAITPAPARRLPAAAAALVIAALSALLWFGLWKLAALLF